MAHTTNVTPLRQNDEASDFEKRLASRFGITQAQLHAALKPLFLLMYDHGIENVSIARNGMKAVVSVDGESL
ncbi:hypothetical protein WT27_13665 [Burkholderia territorii]|uniref:Uncharacterized protein n=1 Tax=Burkholderia territorii TaxID=1503055 RepID=A0A105V486_9BURK|nr:hypothetical protein [Burkholderia territorii]KVV40963.1 hypothetical protein WT27_13665 [Burkholderia territorii]KVX33912.1 hypothetical protein WT31_09575 [Burkholderia territorii]